MDKATQTEETGIFGDYTMDAVNDASTNKSEEKFKQRLQRVQHRTGEHSVSSQTLSPIHSEYHPIIDWEKKHSFVANYLEAFEFLLKIQEKIIGKYMCDMRIHIPCVSIECFELWENANMPEIMFINFIIIYDYVFPLHFLYFQRVQY